MTENKFMGPLIEVWHRRCREHGLKHGSKKYTAQAEAFLEGALQMAYINGLINYDRMQIVYFLVGCGRIDMYLTPPLK